MENRELIEALYEAFARFDIPAMVGALDETVEWTEAEGFPYAGTHVGPQAVLDKVWTRMANEWSRWTAVPDRIIVEGNRVAVAGTYTGIYRATGKPIRARFAHMFELSDGKILRMEQFVDSATVNKALT